MSGLKAYICSNKLIVPISANDAADGKLVNPDWKRSNNHAAKKFTSRLNAIAIILVTNAFEHHISVHFQSYEIERSDGGPWSQAYSMWLNDCLV
jgi:hypothetical protein